jgi:hypothetical protein
MRLEVRGNIPDIASDEYIVPLLAEIPLKILGNTNAVGITPVAFTRVLDDPCIGILAREHGSDKTSLRTKPVKFLQLIVVADLFESKTDFGVKVTADFIGKHRMKNVSFNGPHAQIPPLR